MRQVKVKARITAWLPNPFQTLAKRGHAASQRFLAIIFQKGQGVELDS
jgi:hypothetical protein